MKKERAYVVYGITGEYEDYRSWDVAVFEKEADADEFLKKLKTAYKPFKNSTRSTNGPFREPKERKKLVDAMRKFDPFFMEDYTGTDYFVLAIPFYRHGLYQPGEAKAEKLESSIRKAIGIYSSITPSNESTAQAIRILKAALE